MIIVLDTNEYIEYISGKVLLLDKVVSNDKNLVYINETITKEVINNLSESLIKKFYEFLFKNNISVYYQRIPLNLFQKYKKLGFKKGDIVVAAFCESVSAEYLISENRGFLKNIQIDAFKVVTLKDFLNKVSKQK